MSIRRIAVAGVLLAALAIPSIAFAQARMKVLLDTDIGTDIDDAWALGLLIASPSVDLVGVTITDGDTAARAKVACKLLHVTGRDEVPVAAGRRTELSQGRGLPVHLGRGVHRQAARHQVRRRLHRRHGARASR
jgi:inosine-uridine nucleoside N-ribohydrolase